MYNEEKKISIKDYETAFNLDSSIDYLLIDDCSTDNTYSIIKNITASFTHVTLFQNKINLGKGPSIRQGILQSDLEKYDFIGYLDADLSVSFFEMEKLLNKAIANKDRPFVMGSRIKLISNNISRSKRRHYLGRLFATVVSQFLIKIPVYDTQCGAKIIESQLALQLFNLPLATKWLFDIELLLRYKNINNQLANNVLEVPLNEWIEKGDTKIKLKELFLFPFQIIKLSVKYA